MVLVHKPFRNLPPDLVRRENTLGEASSFEQGKTQQHRIAHTAPNRTDDVIIQGDILHQDRIDAHADNNEKCLKAQGHQGAQVILAHAAPFPSHHSRHRDGSHRGHEVDFHHPAINDDEYADGERPHGNTHKQRLEPQAEQRPQLHLHQATLHVGDNGADVDAGIRNDNAGCLIDNALCHIKHTHDDVPGIGDNQDGAGRFENPFEKDRCFDLVEVILVGDDLDQFQRHDKR